MAFATLRVVTIFDLIPIRLIDRIGRLHTGEEQVDLGGGVLPVR
jgi:hypothetical protein